MEDKCTKQLKLTTKERLSSLSSQPVIDDIREILSSFPKQLNLQLVSVVSEDEMILTFNKIKAAVRFFDQMQSHPLLSHYTMHFTCESFGSYDKKRMNSGTCDLYISNCFASSIHGNEIKALQEIESIINSMLEESEFPSIHVKSISLAMCYVYITFHSVESLDYILEKIQEPSWRSPESLEYPFCGNMRWEVQRAHCVPVQPYSQTQESRQIYYSPNNASTIPGLKLFEEIISPMEEQEILHWTDRPGDQGQEDNWEHRVQGKKKPMKRRVQHYGYRFNYETNSADTEPYHDGSIPEIFQPIIERMLEQGIIHHRPDQLTINEYMPGQGILLHVDTHSAFEDEIVSISLGSNCGMEFCHFEDQKKKIGVYLPRCSVFVLSEDARYVWKHGITKKCFDHVQHESEESIGTLESKLFPESNLQQRERRVSLTFRKVRSVRQCNCKWPIACDSQEVPKPNKTGKASDLSDDIVSRLQSNDQNGEEFGRALERKHVVEFYETAAEHFSSTRHSPWPRISRFLVINDEKKEGVKYESYDGIERDMIIGDIGCGNGKYLRCIPNSIPCIGTDISNNLLVESKKLGTHNHDVVVADGLSLPMRSEICDVVICIAVFHHISTLERRLKLASELLRILKVNGRLLVYAWAFEQKEDEVGSRKFPSQDCFVPWHLATKKGDHSKEQVLNRYCHVFCEGELEKLFLQVGNVSILNSYNDHSNWAIVVRKNPTSS